MQAVAGVSRQVQESLRGVEKVLFERFDFYPVRKEELRGKGEK